MKTKRPLGTQIGGMIKEGYSIIDNTTNASRQHILIKYEACNMQYAHIITNKKHDALF